MPSRRPGATIRSVTLRFMSLADIADYTGIPLNNLKAAALRGAFPPPDVEIGLADVKQRRSKGWAQQTVDDWLASRK